MNIRQDLETHLAEAGYATADQALTQESNLRTLFSLETGELVGDYTALQAVCFVLRQDVKEVEN